MSYTISVLKTASFLQIYFAKNIHSSPSFVCVCVRACGHENVE